MSSGGSCRSASIIATASPRAWSRPAVSATWWPKFRERRITRTRGSRSASARSCSPVESLEPSSTRTSSNGRPSRAAVQRATNAVAVSSSSNIGATTERSRSSRVAGAVRVDMRAGTTRRRLVCRAVSGDHCSACGATRLEPWLAVGGEAGEQGLIPTTDAFGTALSDLVRCADCGHGQLATFPAEAVLAEAYEEAESEGYVDEEAGQRETARRALERIEAHATKGALLDLGCWVGFPLAEAPDRGGGAG